jgi:dipeptidyl-peptidase-4
MTFKPSFCVAAFAACLPSFIGSLAPAPAQDAKPLTLQRIYASGEFAEKSVGCQWLPNVDGKSAAYTIAESAPDGHTGQRIVRYDAETGASTVMVSADELVPAEQSDPLSLQGYEWSADLSRLLIYTNSKRVWRRNTRGDYWVLNRTSGQLRKLGGDAKPSTLMFAKFSPDGSQVAYVREGNLYVENLNQPSIRQLTSRPNERVINGTSDWVYEEEFGLRDAFHWSPDGRRIAFWRFDTSCVGDFTMINNTDSLYPTTKVFAYPKAGTTNSDVRIAVADLQSGETTLVELPGDPRENYVPRIQWIEPTGELVVRQMNRAQNREDIYLINFQSRVKRRVHRATDDAWIDLQDSLTFRNDAESFFYLSDRDGWWHLYEVSLDDAPPQLMTPGDFDIVSLLKVVQPDSESSAGSAYFIASPDTATERYLYRADLDDATVARVTPKGRVGSHSYEISPNGQYAIHRFNSVTQPTITSVVRLPDHSVVRVLEDNSELAKKLSGLTPVTTKFLQIDIGDVKLDAWMMQREDASEGRHPLLTHVYGEPAGATVVNRWGGKSKLWHRMMAERGFVVVSIDNRGTKAPRGRAFRKAVYRRLATLGPNDQAKAVRKLIKTNDHVDPQRIGVWGWSGGGTSSLHSIFRYPSLYRTAVAVAPVANLSYYDTIYEERYMSRPSDNVEGYRRGSAIHFAHQLSGNLLLIHGTADDNVHYQASELLINELIKQNKQFDMFIYPGRTHSIKEGKHTRIHLMTKITEYLEEHLGAGDQ